MNNFIARIDNWRVLVGGIMFCLFAFAADLLTTLIAIFGRTGFGEASELLSVSVGARGFSAQLLTLQSIQSIALLTLTLVIYRSSKSCFFASLPWWAWGGRVLWVATGNAALIILG